MVVLAACAALVFLVGTAGPAARGAGSTVETATVTVQGAATQALTDGRGRTLYYLSTDTPARSTCTGGCARVWPPLLSASAPTSGGPLPGRLARVRTGNGPQVSYNRAPALHLLRRHRAPPDERRGVRRHVVGGDRGPEARRVRRLDHEPGRRGLRRRPLLRLRRAARAPHRVRVGQRARGSGGLT